jgi:hypothetical protein
MRKIMTGDARGILQILPLRALDIKSTGTFMQYSLYELGIANWERIL